jgi:hypothetical protein
MMKSAFCPLGRLEIYMDEKVLLNVYMVTLEAFEHAFATD